MTDSELRSKHGLTRPQYDALRRSVEISARFGQENDEDPIPRASHAKNGLSYGAASPTIKALSNNGYISLDLVHSADEIASLRARLNAAVDSATALLGERDWKNALSELATASKLDSAAERRRWKLTEKATRVVALVEGASVAS